MQFIRETWVYLLLPFVVLGLAILVAVWTSGDSPTPFSYQIY